MDEKAQMLRLVAFHMASGAADLDDQLVRAQKIYDYMVGAGYTAEPAGDPAEPQPVMNPA